MEIKRNLPNSSFSLFRNILILKVYKIQLNCEKTTLSNVFYDESLYCRLRLETQNENLVCLCRDYSKFDQQYFVHVFTPLFKTENGCPTACILFNIESKTADETRINWDLIILNYLYDRNSLFVLSSRGVALIVDQ